MSKKGSIYFCLQCKLFLTPAADSTKSFDFVADIKDYFKRKLDLYTTNAARTNLHYELIFKETPEEKYTAVRDLIEQKDCPAAKTYLCERYSRSKCLPLCLDLLGDFEKSVQRKYKTDLDMFIHESKLEDFYRCEMGTILVSTIHKSKDREFDSVYMFLNNVSCDTDE